MPVRLAAACLVFLAVRPAAAETWGGGPLGFEALAVEREAGLDVSDAYARLTGVVAEARERLEGVTRPREALRRIADVAGRACPRLEAEVADGLYSGALALGVCDCDILTVTYLTIADDLGLPLSAVFTPGHVLVVWDDGSTRVYWETTTGEERPEWLLRTLVPSGAERAYLQPQTREQMMGYVYQVRAGYRFSQGDVDGARSDFAIAERLNPTFVVTFYNRARVRLLLGEYASARADLDRTLDLDPTHADALYSRALTLVALGHFRGALRDLDAVTRQAGPAADVAHVRGVALAGLGHDDRALASYAEALDLDPQMTFAYRARGELLASLGRADEARRDYEAFLRLTPATSPDVAAVREQIAALDAARPGG